MTDQEQAKLEYKILFALTVAGKSAKFAEEAMDKFLGANKGWPLAFIGSLVQSGRLLIHIKACKMGNYNKLEFAFADIYRRCLHSELNLSTCTPEDLEKTRGIGCKTSRFFILWTRPTARFAALDTHILKWLRFLGYDAPTSTPSGAKYAEMEAAFLAEADKRSIPPAALDYIIWEYCRDGLHKGGVWEEPMNKV